MIQTCGETVDETIRFLSYSISKKLSDVIINILLYSVNDRWSHLDNFSSESLLSLVFSTPPVSYTMILIIIRPRLLQNEVTELDICWKAVMCPSSERALNSPFRSRLLLFSADGLAEPIIRVKGSRFDKKGKIVCGEHRENRKRCSRCWKLDLLKSPEICKRKIM